MKSFESGEQTLPIWVESCTLEDRTQSGKLYMADQAVAAYEKPYNRAVRARLVAEVATGEIIDLTDVEPKSRPLQSVEAAKQYLEHITVSAQRICPTA